MSSISSSSPAPASSASPTERSGTSESNATTARPRAGRWLAVTRIALGFIFLWAFLDKTFGLGYSTPAARAWIKGGSPTSGFLGHADIGPLAGAFRALSGIAILDWLFMLGMLGLGVALILGIGLRVSAAVGTLILMLMYVAEWPPATRTRSGQPSGSTNPIVDYHLLYALMLISLALLLAGRVWGLGSWWQSTALVRRNPWVV